VAPSNGTFDNDYPSGANDSPHAGLAHGRQDGGDGEAGQESQQETPQRMQDSHGEQQLADRTRGGNRRPSGTVKEQRMCGKCGTHLTGQFVRALGGTFHLECFTCHVSSYALISSETLRSLTLSRTATR
jgi:hypothetical protein